MKYKAWSDGDLGILKRVYPDHGCRAVYEALRKVGRERTLGAIGAAAVRYNVRRNGYFWAPEEERILNDHWADGAKSVQRALKAAGYDRTLKSIKGKVEANGGTCGRDRPLTETSIWLILDYADDGFGVEEIAEEINRTPEVIADVLDKCLDREVLNYGSTTVD